jgi:hypothetical protein
MQSKFLNLCENFLEQREDDGKLPRCVGGFPRLHPVPRAPAKWLNINA